MSVMRSVRLPEELDERIRYAAKQRGKSVNRLMVEVMDEGIRELPPSPLRADIGLADIIGIVSSNGTYDAKNAEEDFGMLLDTKQREGSL